MSEEGKGDRVGYVDAGGHVHGSARDAISGSIGFESASGTGAGCGQDPDNVGGDQDSGGGDQDAGDSGDGDGDGDSGE